jgi:hypothetical protein
MKRFTHVSPSVTAVLLASMALVSALALSSCSRSGVADSLTGPSHAGAVAFAKGKGNGGGAPPPPAPPPVADPCVSLAGFGGAIVPVAASVPQNRVDRLRIEVQGDVAAGTVNKISTCATPVSFVSGSATVSGSGGLGVSETFGTLAAVPGEAGVVLATAANGDVLEIIWPGLTGLPPAPPIFRCQLARSGQAGSTLSVSMSVTARTSNGATATFTAAASGLVIPALK